jgi:DNA-binding response OmpR family regulator
MRMQERVAGQYVRARDLANQLTSPDGFPLDDHGIEQIVSQIRRKLGEPPKRPLLLRNRPGFGYALCPEE